MGRTPFVREINRVIFTPYTANVVGIYENPFTTVDTKLTGNAKFRSSAVVGNKVIFTPLNADAVGIYNVDSEEFSKVDTTGLDGTTSKFISKHSGDIICLTSVRFNYLN